MTYAEANVCVWGGDLETFAAGCTLAFGHLGHQKDRLQTDRHGLQFPEAAALAVDFLAATGRTLDPVRSYREYKTHATILVARFDVIVAFPDSKRMIQQTLTHASGYEFLTPDSNFPEEPKKQRPQKQHRAES